MKKIIHHGGAKGVTGSCHELFVDKNHSLLIDCGLFQGAEASPNGASFKQLEIEFSLEAVQALLLTHCHIDHVGRIPYLIAANFDQPIYCTEATAKLLPLVLEDALKIGFTRNTSLIQKFLKKIDQLLVVTPYHQWVKITSQTSENWQEKVEVRFQPAGHILGSAYIEIRWGQGSQKQKVIFSGDLGAPWTPLLPSPKSPYSCDLLVLESTYGDRLHKGRKLRTKELRQRILSCFQNRGTILIPAFSIGRTQELLYEIEQIIYREKGKKVAHSLLWEDLDVIVDSPLANQFTKVYRELKSCWDQEAKRVVKSGRHPLNFEQLLTIDSHKEHLQTVDYLKHSGRPAIVLAASGMCTGGRIVNYLKALLEDPRTDLLFVGYQAQGTPGRIIQKYGPKKGYVELDGRRYNIQASVHTLTGYSAHADQKDLVNFVQRMRKPPEEVRLIHGDSKAKKELEKALNSLGIQCFSSQ